MDSVHCGIIEKHNSMKKEKINIEYVLDKVSHMSLWNQLTTPLGLSAWFADSVSVKNNEYTFKWDKNYIQKARAVLVIPNIKIRYQWEEETDTTAYFEFAIHTMELTKTTALQITDFVEPDDKTSSIELWDAQIDTLKRTLGI